MYCTWYWYVVPGGTRVPGTVLLPASSLTSSITENITLLRSRGVCHTTCSI